MSVIIDCTWLFCLARQSFIPICFLCEEATKKTPDCWFLHGFPSSSIHFGVTFNTINSILTEKWPQDPSHQSMVGVDKVGVEAPPNSLCLIWSFWTHCLSGLLQTTFALPRPPRPPRLCRALPRTPLRPASLLLASVFWKPPDQGSSFEQGNSLDISNQLNILILVCVVWHAWIANALNQTVQILAKVVQIVHMVHVARFPSV